MKIDLTHFDAAIEAAGDATTDWMMEDSVPAFNVLTELRDAAEAGGNASDPFRKGRLYTTGEVLVLMEACSQLDRSWIWQIIETHDRNSTLSKIVPDPQTVAEALELAYAEEDPECF